MSQIPDEVMSEFYLDPQVHKVPCLFKSVMIQAMERAIKDSGYEFRKENENDESVG